jgi:hypothetical protein
MGTCKYCGKPAGFLRKIHPECKQKNQAGWSQMIQLAQEAAQGKAQLNTLSKSLTQIASQSYVPLTQVQEALVAGWAKAVDVFLDDNVLQDEEEAKLLEFMSVFQLNQLSLDQNGAYTKVVKAGVLRDIMKGNLPERLKGQESLPFNFQKGESLVWVFSGVEYLEDKVRREYVGQSAGVSVRVAKGLYLRSGSFHGRPIEYTVRLHVDTGRLAVTNKHIYFGGSKTSFRVPFQKIVSFESFSDGIGIMRDASNAKLQVFMTGDGWFSYNLLSNLARL